jgi:peptide deformylase
MEVVSFPHPALRWKSKPIQAIDADLKSVVREMFELMYAHEGVGLAANQVALPYRVFVANVTGDSSDKDSEIVFINPEIVRRKGSIEAEEGCLSLPKLYGQVRRAEQIVVEAFDLRGRAFEYTLTDLPGRVVQHECDHLDGVLFIDRMSDAARRELEPRLADFEAYFRRRQDAGEIPSNEDIEARLRSLEPAKVCHSDS